MIQQYFVDVTDLKMMISSKFLISVVSADFSYMIYIRENLVVLTRFSSGNTFYYWRTLCSHNNYSLVYVNVRSSQIRTTSSTIVTALIRRKSFVSCGLSNVAIKNRKGLQR